MAKTKECQFCHKGFDPRAIWMHERKCSAVQGGALTSVNNDLSIEQLFDQIKHHEEAARELNGRLQEKLKAYGLQIDTAAPQAMEQVYGRE